MTLWTDTEGGCLNACLASLVGCNPSDVPHEDWLDLERLNGWLAEKGQRLEPVLPAATWGESYPPFQVGIDIIFLGVIGFAIALLCGVTG
jgi:hypothetical protein